MPEPARRAWSWLNGRSLRQRAALVGAGLTVVALVAAGALSPAGRTGDGDFRAPGITEVATEDADNRARSGRSGSDGGRARAGARGTSRGEGRHRGRGGAPSGAVGGRDGGRGGGRNPGTRGGGGGRDQAPGGSGRPSAGEIVIGVEAIDTRAAESLGASVGLALGPSDLRLVAEAVGAHINATGGIGGRKLRIRAHVHDLFDGAPYSQHIREMCLAFRAMARVTAVVTLAGEPLAGCLRPHGIAVLTVQTPSTRELGVHPDHLFAPEALALDRFAVPYVRALKERGFFDGRVRVGLGRPSGDPFFEDVARALDRALRDAGIRVAERTAVPAGESASDLGPAAAIIAASVLRARAANVNRIIGFDIGGGFAVFMRAAAAQGYEPRYGPNTTWSPAYLQAEVPRGQLRGAVGVGWSPLLDVDAARDDAIPRTRGECAGIFSGAGVDPGGRDVLGQQPAYAYCGSLLMLRDALERSPGTRSGLEAVVEGRGAATALATRFGAQRHDGAAGIRQIAFDADCRCMRYIGATTIAE